MELSILALCRDLQLKQHIIEKANLSHVTLKPILKKLMDLGLLEKTSRKCQLGYDSPKKYFITTFKGRELLTELRVARDILKLKRMYDAEGWKYVFD